MANAEFRVNEQLFYEGTGKCVKFRKKNTALGESDSDETFCDYLITGKLFKPCIQENLEQGPSPKY